MSDSLSNFLVDLASDSDRLARFMNNPGAELDQTDLTEEERTAVLSRDSRRLANTVGISAQKSGLGITSKKKGPKKPGPKKPGRPGGGKKKKR